MLSVYLYLFHLQELPDSLKEQTYLKEWHVYNTLIQTIPAYIALFQNLRVLELSKNQINHLPAEIGELIQDIQIFILIPLNSVSGKRASMDIVNLRIISSLFALNSTHYVFISLWLKLYLPNCIENHEYGVGKSTFLLSDYKAVIACIQVDGELFMGTGGALYSLQIKKNKSIAEF